MATSAAATRYVLSKAGDGSLGYDDGKRVTLFGPEKEASHVGTVTVTRTRSRSWSFGPQWKQLGVAKTIGDGHEVAYELSNILFAYQQSGGPDGEAVYVETAWQPHLMVRPLDPHALLGDGALLRSNKGRVFVLDSSIPCADQFVKRGYLKVNVNEVHIFLEKMRWASRSEGHRPAKSGGLTVPTFVIKDKTTWITKRYYVVCKHSPWVREQLVCHLEPIGLTKDAMCKFVPKKGDEDLGDWVRRKHTASSKLLFD